jgi:hypothetical protein
LAPFLKELIWIKEPPAAFAENAIVPLAEELTMSSFSCPHYEMDGEHCRRLSTDCVPGRRGCVLARNSVFAVPAEQRVREKELAKRKLRENLPPRLDTLE